MCEESPPRIIHSTRLVDLVNALDAKQAALIHLADHVDEGPAADPVTEWPG
ncbi:hypothetical protein J0X20_00215 [Streptomyces sp. KCTC 0041BP]|uniref:hypothetical protein n=1 Tax=Streptomyces sp. KCTC 0041BP TaxID=201500 RepID=UPI001AE1E32F|nr:hypothetical protein [Streptomyces sp. KCTC 0041BP]MBP0932079.1 hypothetical protein [Streptomyces sp. KCTC 0041BP]